jgi:DNA-binding CsgD family transcriptional regulator
MIKSEKQVDILTIREFEILKFLAKGYSTKEISDILNLSPFTIKTHRQIILKKLKAKNCTEAIYKAIKMDLI